MPAAPAPTPSVSIQNAVGVCCASLGPAIRRSPYATSKFTLRDFFTLGTLKGKLSKH